MFFVIISTILLSLFDLTWIIDNSFLLSHFITENEKKKIQIF